jgi:predicted transcriptional regulator
MRFMDDWHAVKSAVAERKAVEVIPGKIKGKGKTGGFMLNKTDIEIIKTLLSRGKSSLKDLRGETDRSRVSVYMSLRELKEISLVEEKDHMIELSKNPLVDSISDLFNERFKLENLLGERIRVLQSLMDWKEPEQIAVECNISSPSVYRYLRGLKSLIRKRGRRYKLGDGNKGLLGLLGIIKTHVETSSETFQVWSSPEGRLLRAKNEINGSLTAFSRFPEFGVNFSSDYMYYYVPKKELSMEEIFVHSLRCDEGGEMLPTIREFYIRNNERIDTFSVDKLALRFDVANSWLDLQASIVGIETNDDDDPELYYLSPENIFLAKSLSNALGDILECERIMKKEELSWGMLFHEYFIQEGDSNFRWQEIISRLKILEKRTGIRIPIIKKLSNIYLEKAIIKATGKPKTIRELKDELGISEYRIRNALSKMIRWGLIRKIEKKPLKFVSCPLS